MLHDILIVQFIVYALVAFFFGLTILGHVLVLQAIFKRSDDAPGKSEEASSARGASLARG